MYSKHIILNTYSKSICEVKNTTGIIEVKEIFAVVKSEREREREREKESIITNRQKIFTIFNVDIAPAL